MGNATCIGLDTVEETIGISSVFGDSVSFKCIIAGGRDISDPAVLHRALEQFSKTSEITEVVCGMAVGVDTLGRDWATAQGIPVKEFPANWKPNGPDGKFARRAGPIRNIQMADYADGLLAIPGRGTGTRHMIAKASERGLIVFVYEPNKNNAG